MLIAVKHTSYKLRIWLLVAFTAYMLSVFIVQYNAYQNTPTKVQSFLSSEIIQQEKDFLAIVNDTSLLSSIFQQKETALFNKKLFEKKYGFFLLNNNNLVYWNTNKLLPTKEDFSKQDGSYFTTHQNGKFEFIKKTITLNKQSVIVTALIPIYWNYFIDNKYLNSGFVSNTQLSNAYEIVDTTTTYIVKNMEGKNLFSIQPKKNNTAINYSWFTIFLRLLAIFCLFVFIHQVADYLANQGNYKKAFVFLSGSILVIRLLSYFTNFPFKLSDLPLFDPSIYASNFIHPSLGDLLVNSFLTLWLVVFVKFYFGNYLANSSLLKQKRFGYIGLILLTLITLLISTTITSLVRDSKVSFEVNNFFSLTIYSVIAFIILSISILIFFHSSHILLQIVYNNKIPLLLQIAITTITGFLILSTTKNNATVIAKLFTTVWLCVFITILFFRKKDIQLPIFKSSFFIFWAMFLTLSVATLVMYENNFTELEQRKKWAEKLATQNDPNSENLLKIAITNFNEDFLYKNFHRFTQEFSSKYIKDSLVNENFSGYLNKYDTRIYFFDSSHRPLYNDDSTSYTALKNTIDLHGTETSITNLYTYNTNQKQGYIYESSITKDTINLGYLFVTVKPKRYKSEALYPELFRQVQNLSSDFNTNYAYAIYSNNILIDHLNDYSFPANLRGQKIPSIRFEKRKQDDYNELWYNSGSGKIIIIAKKTTLMLELFTLFAYLFCCFLLLLSIFYVANFLIKSGLNREKFSQAFQLNIRTQIHSTIIFISIFSFFIIGIATISFFIYRFNQNNEERLSKSIQVMANEIEEKIRDTRSQLIFDDVLTINDIGYGTNIEKTVTQISEVHNIDVNFYSNTGSLIASTQPYIFNKNILSNKMQPQAYYELQENKKIRFTQTEKIGNFKYLSIYVPVKDENGETYAYLNVPYFNSRSELNQEISGFLATLLNLNAFIFLLAGAIAYFATERITASFSIISDKMKAINLEKHNEEIIWERNDEIGSLVSEYNKMVQKLDESAKALAKSEREGAWREMARQVAHEIKNPLTPMKLSIQYLQKNIDNNSDNIKQLTHNVATTLIEQIEQLSKIAGDFSQFANIGNAKPEVFDVSEIIHSLIQLYSTREKVKIEWEKEEKNSLINADKIQISRLFANLFLNAIEAAQGKELIEIHITQNNVLKQVEIAISDNGMGIEDEMKNKIFTPNFTTKSSGTGLGLAICKGIVEKANGSISFETEKNKGTTFKVFLPLV